MHTEALPALLARRDVHRNIQLNDRPVTPQQQQALEDWLAQLQSDRRH